MEKKLTSIEISNIIEGMNYEAALEYCTDVLGAKRDPMGHDAIARFYYDGADDFYAFMFFKSIDHKPILTKSSRPKFHFNHQVISFVS